MRRALITVVAVTLFAISGSGADKVAICHIPPDNPQNAHTIRVAQPAVQAHLDHGDFPLPCEALGASPVSIFVFAGLLAGWALFKLRKAPIFDRS
jgi:hypothetical protein